MIQQQSTETSLAYSSNDLSLSRQTVSESKLLLGHCLCSDGPLMTLSCGQPTLIERSSSAFLMPNETKDYRRRLFQGSPGSAVHLEPHAQTCIYSTVVISSASVSLVHVEYTVNTFGRD
jgi:hypothetical protein